MEERIEELRSELAALASEIDELRGKAEPTEEDNDRFEEAIEDFAVRQAEFELLEARPAKIAKIKEFAERVSSHEPGAEPDVLIKKDRNLYDVRDAKMVSDSPQAYEAELRSRALSAIEEAPEHAYLEDEGREHATKLIERMDEDTDEDSLSAYVSRHILHTGSPEYRKLFKQAMRGNVVAQSELHERNRNLARPGYNEPGPVFSESRAAMSLTNANGGFLVPFELDPSIILTTTTVVNPFRQISRVVQTRTNVWHGVTSAGATAEWLAEAAEAADGSPTFGQPTVTAHKGASYIQASFELIEDSTIASDVAMLLAECKDRLEGAAFATGSGSGQPTGIVTALGLVTASRVSGSSVTGGIQSTGILVAQDIYELDNAMNPRYRPGASFVANKSIWNSVRQFATANNYHAYWTDFGGGRPSILIGYPVYEASAMDSTVVSGSTDDVIILGDFSQFLVAERIGVSVAYNPLVISTGSNRPTGEVGWFMHFRVGSNVTDANAFRMLRL